MKQVYLTDNEINLLLNLLDFPSKYWKHQFLKHTDDDLLHNAYSIIFSNFDNLILKLENGKENSHES